MNDPKLKLAIARMLPDKIAVVETPDTTCIVWRNYPGDDIASIYNKHCAVLETEWLYIVSLVEQTLRQNQFHYVDYYGELFKVVSGKEHYEGDIGYFQFDLVTATFNQRATAFCKVKGITLE